MQSRGTCLVLDLDVGAGVQQEFDCGRPSSLRCHVQWCRTKHVARFQISAGTEEQLNHVAGIHASGRVQGGFSLLVLDIQARPMGEQESCRRLIIRRHMPRCVSPLGLRIWVSSSRQQESRDVFGVHPVTVAGRQVQDRLPVVVSLHENGGIPLNL